MNKSTEHGLNASQVWTLEMSHIHETALRTKNTEHGLTARQVWILEMFNIQKRWNEQKYGTWTEFQPSLDTGNV